MKRLRWLFFLLLFSSALLNASELQLGFDLRSFDFLFQESLRLDFEAAWKSDDTRVSGVVRYGRSELADLSYLECGMLISVYPFDGYGFNLGCSLIRCGFSWGSSALDSDCLVTAEAFAGWTISMPWVYIEPRIVFSDSFAAESEDVEALRSAIRQFSKFRISLLLGVEIR